MPRTGRLLRRSAWLVTVSGQAGRHYGRERRHLLAAGSGRPGLRHGRPAAHRGRRSGPARPGHGAAAGRDRGDPARPTGALGPHHRADGPGVLPQGRRAGPDHRYAPARGSDRSTPVRGRTDRRRSRGAGHRARTPLPPPAGRARPGLPGPRPASGHPRQGRQLPGGHPGRPHAPPRSPDGRDAPYPADPRGVHRPDAARRGARGRGASGGGDERPYGRAGEPGAPGADLRGLRQHGRRGAHRLGTALQSRPLPGPHRSVRSRGLAHGARGVPGRSLGPRDHAPGHLWRATGLHPRGRDRSGADGDGPDHRPSHPCHALGTRRAPQRPARSRRTAPPLPEDARARFAALGLPTEGGFVAVLVDLRSGDDSAGPESLLSQELRTAGVPALVGALAPGGSACCWRCVTHRPGGPRWSGSVGPHSAWTPRRS